MKIKLIEKKLELKVNWKISRNETTVKNNFFIVIEDQFIGEIAPNIRYCETPDVIKTNFNDLIKENIKLDSLNNIWERGDFCHSFKFGVESALVAYEANKNNQSISTFLGLSEPLKDIPT